MPAEHSSRGSNGAALAASFRPLASADPLLLLQQLMARSKCRLRVVLALILAVACRLLTPLPGTNPVVTYDANGLITTGRALQPSDLPAPSGGELGAVKAGAGINIAADGTSFTKPDWYCAWHVYQADR